ncbi:3-hydroxyacyl-ACP dehydratase FabZ family protein [Chitinophaga nivalis]|uniref:Hydroxymyristoyl-ACP dehydratase n=1 Tax=Chitinophaga nivalis TaxID=2991709 RepID=A0ABT3IHY1_9BACT|nr:FabA/FabZ family ACP-dehydratase [Chitinophaga nivalis]MCW3466747.1 hydroxymyristoyl-ACP dehydratase [Chitinophaga nivalis]MCW3483562.1 hydroxymyristoyl-ACP dehydratase [Chitinophaga nivalis]
MDTTDIIARLPFAAPFLFVDTLEHIDEEKVIGSYTFRADLAFYAGHFKQYPVTPGVLLTEMMAQTGLACLAIYLTRHEPPEREATCMMTAVNVAFLLPVFPGEKVTVTAEKIYFRFGKLKCKVSLRNEAHQEVCNGTIEGMLINSAHA